MSSEQPQPCAESASVRSSVEGALTERLAIGLQELKSSGVLCDVVLKGAEESAVGIPCHRLVLSAQSSYFRTMFASDWKESAEKEIRLRNISSNTLQKLVDYAYTVMIPIDDGNVQPLLAAAIFFDFSPVATLCWNYLEEHMDVSSYLQVYSLAKMHNNPRLAEKTKGFVLHHFVKIAQSAEFLLVDAATIVELAASHDLCVESEDQVFEAVKRWCEYDQSGRQTQLSDVLQYIRVPFLSPRRLENYFLVLLNGFMGSSAVHSPPQSTVIQELPGRRSEAIASRCRPRESYGWPKVVVCAGGWDHELNRMDAVQVFSPSMSAVWLLDRSKLPQAVAGCSMVVTENNSLVICGGFEENDVYITKRVCQLDLFRNECTDLAPMSVSRAGGGAATLKGGIYVVGGLNAEDNILADMECYDSEQGTWQSVAGLPFPLIFFALVASKDRLYVFGGNAQLDSGPLNSTFCYDPQVNAWSKLADMPTARRQCRACIGSNGLIYVIGGWDSDQTSRCVEAYDPVSNQWSKKSDTINEHGAAGCAYVDGKIYVLGGCSDTTDSDIEVYDEDADVWSLLPCRLPAAKADFGCAVMTVKHGDNQLNLNFTQQ
ncbi:kelch-like protein diablo [Paramacrobiotus metropolitanus]|uniref:kelch-like protein diablo n=1 Tax=Paramacrobiotus metropolitanus TaxID=2943436 RepID=UPI0024465050|nr:kelch-like protein diablo [Paramacrobiotus metropolitanus]